MGSGGTSGRHHGSSQGQIDLVLHGPLPLKRGPGPAAVPSSSSHQPTLSHHHTIFVGQWDPNDGSEEMSPPSPAQATQQDPTNLSRLLQFNVTFWRLTE